MSYNKSLVGVRYLSESNKMSVIDQDSKLISALPEYNIEKDDTEGYNSDESLGLLPDLIDLSCDSPILSPILNEDKFNNESINDRNVSCNEMVKFSDFLNHKLRYEDEDFTISPISKSTSIYYTQADSPVHCDQSIPEYTSTPTHLISNLNVNNEIISPQDEPNFCLNETISLDSNDKEMDSEHFLNKTTVIETCIDPMIMNMQTSTCSKSENTNSQENILNTTLILTKPIDTNNTSLNQTFEILDNLEDKCTSTINHTEQNSCSETNILNTTFAKNDESLKYDTCSKTLKCITNLEENKKTLQHGSKTITRKKIVENKKTLQRVTKTITKKKRAFSFSTRNGTIENIKFKNKDVQFDKTKNMRKSSDCFGKNILQNDSIKQSSNSFVSNMPNSSKVHKEEKVFSFSKGLFPENIESVLFKEKNVNVNPNYSNTETGECMPLKFSDSKPKDISMSKIKLKNSQKLLMNTTINFYPEISDVDKTTKCSPNSNFKPEVMKSVSKMKLMGSPEPLLNLSSPPITDGTKTVIKKPRHSMQINYCKENLSDSYELPLVKNIKSSIPPFQNMASTKISQTREEKMTPDVTKTVIKKPRHSMQINYRKENLSDPCKLPLVKEVKSTIPPFQNRASVMISPTRKEKVTQDVTKTVIKKPRHSMQINYLKGNGLDPLELPFEKNIESLSAPITDATKTIIKKPRNSMQVTYLKDTDSLKLSLAKNIKTVIPSFKKRPSMKISQTREEKTILGFNENKNFTLSNKIALNDPVSLEEKKVSRLPQKDLSQKMEIHSGSQSSNIKQFSNIANPHSSIPAVQLLTTSKKTLSSSSRKSLNPRSELAGKAISNTVSSQKSQKKITKTFKHFSNSRIPSVPHFPARKN